MEGLSADYLVYSMLGYAAYAAYTSALHFSPGVQAAYMLAHGGSAPDVQLTDVVFAGHALLVTLATLWQCVLYGGSSGGSGLATSRVCNITAAGVLLAVAAFCGHIGSTCGLSDCDAWLPLLYLLGFIKVRWGSRGKGQHTVSAAGRPTRRGSVCGHPRGARAAAAHLHSPCRWP